MSCFSRRMNRKQMRISTAVHSALCEFTIGDTSTGKDPFTNHTLNSGLSKHRNKITVPRQPFSKAHAML